MTPEQITDLMAQIVRVGFVNARQPEKMRVKVTLKDTPTSELVTDWLPVLCPRACKDMQYDLPDEGDQVLCLFLPYGREQGFVVGAMYGKQTPPVRSGDKWHRTFSDGTTLEYDRGAHKLSINVQGDFQLDVTGKINVKAGGPMTLEAPIIYERGTLLNTAKDGAPGKAVFSGGMEVRDGGISVPAGDVAASGVSLASHTTDGVEPGSGRSSHPTGGSSSSPGTAAMSVAVAASAENIAKNLESLAADVGTGDSDIDRLIVCLPEIAASMAEKETNQLDGKGWIYLHDMFQKWLAGVANSDAASSFEAETVDWKWLMSFQRSYARYFELVQPEYLFSKNAKELLAERLKSSGKFTEHEENFDYIGTSFKAWPLSYFQSISVPRQQFPDVGSSVVEGTSIKADGLMVAMGSFMLYALARGRVIPLGEKAGEKYYKIIIAEVGIVAVDRLNFEGTQSYRYWRCEPPAFSYLNKDGFQELTNEAFNNFRNKYGRGYDFSVISGPELLDMNQDVTYEYKL